MPGFTINGYGDGASPNVKPYYKYTWELLQVVGTTIGPQSSLPLIYVKEASLPKWTIGKEEVQGASIKYKFAKDISWEDIKIVWYDTVGLQEVMEDWRSLVWTPESGMGVAGKYKNDSKLRSFTFDFANPREWILRNSWPSAVSSTTLTYAESDISVVDVTITYDWAEISKK